MGLRYIYTSDIGTLHYVGAAPKEHIDRNHDTWVPVLNEKGEETGKRPMNDEEYKAHVYERSIPAYATDVYELPEDWQFPDRDRRFRDAWTHTGGGRCHVDMVKAREVHRNHLREMRAPEFEETDKMFIIASQRKQDTTDIVAKAQALRDMPQDPAIDAAQTPDDLRALWPADLPAKEVGANPVSRKVTGT